MIWWIIWRRADALSSIYPEANKTTTDWVSSFAAWSHISHITQSSTFPIYHLNQQNIHRTVPNMMPRNNLSCQHVIHILTFPVYPSLSKSLLNASIVSASTTTWERSRHPPLGVKKLAFSGDRRGEERFRSSLIRVTWHGNGLFNLLVLGNQGVFQS